MARCARATDSLRKQNRTSLMLHRSKSSSSSEEQRYQNSGTGCLAHTEDDQKAAADCASVHASLILNLSWDQPACIYTYRPSQAGQVSMVEQARDSMVCWKRAICAGHCLPHATPCRIPPVQQDFCALHVTYRQWPAM